MEHFIIHRSLIALEALVDVVLNRHTYLPSQVNLLRILREVWPSIHSTDTIAGQSLVDDELTQENLVTFIFENRCVQYLLCMGKVCSLINGFVVMNEHGRKVLLQNPNDEEHFIHVLASVRDNVDCLFVCLRENVCFAAIAAASRK
jgi:hypothetical protein